MKKLCIGIVVLLTIISFGLSKVVKASFKKIITFENAVNLNPKVEFTGDEIYSNYFTEINSYDDLFRESDYILKVTPIDAGEQRAYSYLRDVEVLESYKGEITDRIFIYEPNYFTGLDKYDCEAGYIQMKVSEEYIVFLKSVDATKRSLNIELTNGYTFINKGLSKYKVDEDNTTKLLQEDRDYSFNDINNSEYVGFDNKRIELYLDIKNSVLANHK